MSLPLKRKRESSHKSTGAAACSSSSLKRGGHTSNGCGNGRGNGCGNSCGRRGSHSRSRSHSFHIPSCHASQTVILTEVWKHRTRGTYAVTSQSSLVPPSLPTSHPNKPPPHHQPQPDLIAESPQHLHNPTNAGQYHNLDDFINVSEYQDPQLFHLQDVNRQNGPLRQMHWNKRRNQASTWMDQVIPTLFEPYMDLLQWTKNGWVSVSPAAPDDGACSCSSVSLKVTCVSWDRWCLSFFN